MMYTFYVNKQLLLEGAIQEFQVMKQLCKVSKSQEQISKVFIWSNSFFVFLSYLAFEMSQEEVAHYHTN